MGTRPCSALDHLGELLSSGVLNVTCKTRHKQWKEQVETVALGKSYEHFSLASIILQTGRSELLRELFSPGTLKVIYKTLTKKEEQK